MLDIVPLPGVLEAGPVVFRKRLGDYRVALAHRRFMTSTT